MQSNTIVPFLVVICGPTATGKSGLAIALAQRLQSVILSADSRQVYWGFDIGTAKPTAIELEQTPHYLIDICDPTDTLTVADYQEQTQALITQFHQSGTTPLLVGGTGLYIRAITRGLKIPQVAPQPDLRSHLQSQGQSHNYAILQQVDPVSAARIHPNDQVRTLRALEVFHTTGQPISAQQGECPPPYPILHIGLDCKDPDLLYKRILQRTADMVQQGLVQEVKSLCEKYGTDLPLLNTLGYAEFRDYLAGKCSLEAAIAATALHTRQFAKRQRTWFRAYPEIEWFDADSPDLLNQVWQRVQRFLGDRS